MSKFKRGDKVRFSSVYKVADEPGVYGGYYRLATLGGDGTDIIRHVALAEESEMELVHKEPENKKHAFKAGDQRPMRAGAWTSWSPNATVRLA